MRECWGESPGLGQRDALAAQRSPKLDAAVSIHNGAGGKGQSVARVYAETVCVDGQRSAVLNGHIGKICPIVLCDELSAVFHGHIAPHRAGHVVGLSDLFDLIFPYTFYGKVAIDLGVVQDSDVFRDDPGTVYIQIFFNGDGDFLLGPGESLRCGELKAIPELVSRIPFNEIAPLFIAVGHESCGERRRRQHGDDQADAQEQSCYPFSHIENPPHILISLSSTGRADRPA